MPNTFSNGMSQLYKISISVQILMLDFVWDPKAGDLTETEPTKDSASKAPDATSDKADKVIFGFPMKMIVIVGCGVLAILLVIVGLIWLRRRQRRRTRERELDEVRITSITSLYRIVTVIVAELNS